MDFISLVLIAICLAMDAFAVSLSCGLSCNATRKSTIKLKYFCTENDTLRTALTAGFFFGLFQGLMPLVGYGIGNTLRSAIQSLDHWFTFFILTFIGLNMIHEGCKNESYVLNLNSIKMILILSITTSIDALAMGVTFSFLDTDILLPALMIGLITLVTCFLGVLLGKKISNLYPRMKEKFDIWGGIILVIIGFKILMEHLFL